MIPFMSTRAPEPTHGRPERRRLRSDNPFVALCHLLESVRQRQDVDTLVVADDEGLVIAGAGSHTRCEELAATAPLLARGVPWAARQTPERPVTRPLHLGGLSVLLCSVPRADGSLPDLSYASAGCRRILDATA